MEGRRGRVGLVFAAAGIVAGCTACGAGSSSATVGVDDPASPSPSGSSAHTVTEPIYLDSQTLFAPPPAGTTPELDATQAYDAWARRSRPVPDELNYELGLLTVAPSVTDVLVWGYHLPTAGDCMTHGMVNAPAMQCIQWDFIDADTGEFVQGMSQVVSGPGSDIPTPTPPAGTDELASGGALPPNMERFSPDRLVVQAPLSTIRWTFDMADCEISEVEVVA